MTASTDVQLWFDPVCPFCWLTSKWLRVVADERDLAIRWRFISLRIVNEDVDYDEHFPADYEEGHTAGLRLLRVAARTRDEHGEEAVDRLQWALGSAIWDVDELDRSLLGRPAHTADVLADADLPTDLVGALEDHTLDAVLRAETEEALSLTGEDVGTPILRIGDSPGFVAQRVVALVVNIGCNIAQQGIARPGDVDTAVKLGLAYPHGPLEWGDVLGPSTVLRVLEGLASFYGDGRYRPSPWLRRRAALGVSLLTPEP